MADLTSTEAFTLSHNGTSPEPGPVQYSVAVGYIAVAVAVVFFGSNFLPVKKFKTGNGLFFQWVMCSGVWTVGLVVQFIKGCPDFHPLAMLGGFLWCTGNMLVVPIIHFVGLAKGILIWGSFNLVFGWASSRFGWFGINHQTPMKETMNTIGVVLCLISAIIYLFMRTTGTVEEDEPESSEKAEDIENIEEGSPSPELVNNFQRESLFKTFKNKDLLLKILGSVMAVGAGCLFGLTFVPVIYLQDKYDDTSKEGLDYVFAHFSGIYITSTVYFLIYCAIKKNNPVIFPKIILPGFVSGLMWGIANTCWFIANDALSEAISFPIITTLPGIVGALWGLFFREIKGWKNYLVLAIAISIGVAGAITTGFSK